jgi:hypothetical protein
MNPNFRNHERESRMVELHRAGFTLAQIGTMYGITRERVRQILQRIGVGRLDGGSHRQSQRHRAEKEARRIAACNARSIEAYGCDRETLLRLNAGLALHAKGSMALAYKYHRHNATLRGIGWEFTFPEWCRVWVESGKWEQRGRTRDQYVMARKNDFGPYAAWNVYITTLSQNFKDYQAELKRRGVVCKDGYKRLPERALELGIAA